MAKTIAQLLKPIGIRNSRGGQDSIPAFINKDEARLLAMLGGSGRPDPVTGMPHFDVGDNDDASGDSYGDGPGTGTGDNDNSPGSDGGGDGGSSDIGGDADTGSFSDAVDSFGSVIGEALGEATGTLGGLSGFSFSEVDSPFSDFSLDARDKTNNDQSAFGDAVSSFSQALENPDAFSGLTLGAPDFGAMGAQIGAELGDPLGDPGSPSTEREGIVTNVLAPITDVPSRGFFGTIQNAIDSLTGRGARAGDNYDAYDFSNVPQDQFSSFSYQNSLDPANRTATYESFDPETETWNTNVNWSGLAADALNSPVASGVIGLGLSALNPALGLGFNAVSNLASGRTAQGFGNLASMASPAFGAAINPAISFIEEGPRGLVSAGIQQAGRSLGIDPGTLAGSVLGNQGPTTQALGSALGSVAGNYAADYAAQAIGTPETWSGALAALEGMGPEATMAAVDDPSLYGSGGDDSRASMMSASAYDEGGPTSNEDMASAAGFIDGSSGGGDPSADDMRRRRNWDFTPSSLMSKYDKTKLIKDLLGA